jgi:DNA-binding transcriptional MerR regulator
MHVIKLPLSRDLPEVTMLKIGEFSRLSQVTVKTLHHYDEIGLLKPSHVDAFTEYRYYTLDQLPRLHRIIALKSMGLSLDEIAQLLLEDLPTEQIRGMLRLKRIEAQQRLQEEQSRLAQIEFRLRQIEMVGSMQTVDIVIKRIEPFFALTLRRIAHNRQERQVVAEPIDMAIESGAIKPSGAARFNIFYEEEFRGEYDDYELGIPVAATHSPQVLLAGVGTLQLRELPAIEAAATYLHQGDYDTLNEKYVFLQRWAVENGYKLGAVWRFIWHRGPMHDVDPSEYLTELQHPIEPA